MANAERPSRNDIITAEYFALLDRHLAELVAGKAADMMTLRQIADELCISPKHLSQTIRLTRGEHPCHFYDEKILDEARKLLTGTRLSISEIAGKLTYDPSNFSKFFKKYVGETPGQFRKKNKQ